MAHQCRWQWLKFKWILAGLLSAGAMMMMLQATGLAEDKVAILMKQHLAEVAGKEVTMLTVDYAPGAASAPPCASGFGYRVCPGRCGHLTIGRWTAGQVRERAGLVRASKEAACRLKEREHDRTSEAARVPALADRRADQSSTPVKPAFPRTVHQFSFSESADAITTGPRCAILLHGRVA